jgi:hypothetical protein
MIYMITFDLHGEPRRYKEVNQVIVQAGVGKFVHSMGSYWFIETTHPISNWVNALRKAGDSNDEFFVARIFKDHFAGWMLDGPTKAWLNSSSRTW